MLSHSAFAQNITETHWYFGDSEANLQFDKNGILVYEEDNMTNPFGPGGSAVISRPLNGNLGMYTDGQRMYDGRHMVMAGSATLSGNPQINTPAVASPTPDITNQYVVFTNSGDSGVNEIQYNIVDLSVAGNGNTIAPMGQMTSINQPTGLIRPSEGMIVIKSRNAPNLYWLITQDRETFDFTVSQVSNVGVQVGQPVGFHNTNNPGFEAAHFAYNEQLSLLAVAPKTANRNIWLLDFDDTLGMLGYNRQILNTGFDDGAGEAVYDVEWSGGPTSLGGDKLYISRFGSNDTTVANVYQYDLNDTSDAVVPLLSTPLFRSYGLKRGIDGRIYHLYQESPDSAIYLARIGSADSTWNLTSYEPRYFDTDFNGRQFPMHAPSNFQFFTEVTFRVLDNCEGLDTKFFPIVDPIPNNYFWDLGDGTITNATAPIHGYDAAGIYNVTLYVELNGVVQPSSPQAIEIRGIDDLTNLNLGGDTTICVDEELLLESGVTGGSYLWNTGETTPDITVDTAGVYWVKVTTPDNLCYAFSSIDVTEYGVNRSISNQWYFGERAGIDFNTGAAVPISDNNQMNSLEGCATISDGDGNLLFYTNGITVWDRDHEVMTVLDSTRGSKMLGDSTAAQGVQILPFMNEPNPTMFYIFTANEVYGEDYEYNMTYSIVDLKYDSADGAVVVQNLPLFSNTIEKVTASSFTGSSWLVAHEFGNNSFRTNFVNADGVSATVFTPLGEVLEGYSPEQASGYMKFAPGAQLFANLRPGPNQIELFDFADTSGNFTNARIIETGETEDLYGLEFSSGLNRLYVTTDSKLIQYKLDSLDRPNEIQDITDSKFDGYTTGSGYGALQTGPVGGIIYMAHDNQMNLGTIQNANNDDAAINFNPSAFSLLDRTSRKGLPNFTQNAGDPPQAPGWAFTNPCLGQEVEFVATGTSSIDQYIWTLDSTVLFVDGAEPISDTVALQTFFAEYGTTGEKIVTLNIYNRCGYDSIFVDTLSIYEVPIEPAFPRENTICTGALTLEAVDELDDDNYTYLWTIFNADGSSYTHTERTITFTEPTTISSPDFQTSNLVITNSDGCRTEPYYFIVNEAVGSISLGPDRVYCQYDAIDPLDAFADPQLFDIQWSINGVETDTGRYQDVITSAGGSFNYAVAIVDPTVNCINSDTVNIFINDAPELESFYESPTTCGGNDAFINLELISSGSYAYDFSGQGVGTSGSLDGPAFAPTIGGLVAGTYTYTVINLVTGCSVDEYVLVDDDVPFDLNASNLPDCNVDANMQLTVSGLALPNFVNVFVTDLNGDTVENLQNVRVPLSLAPNLPDGIYFATIQDTETGCFQSDSVQIAPYLPGVDDCLPQIIAPNAFSPNGNGQNEEFFVYPNAFVNDFEIFIYSRWGELVYYSNDQGFRWDGTFKDRNLGPGTFTYIIKFTSLEEPNLGLQAQHGAVTIIR